MDNLKSILLGEKQKMINLGKKTCTTNINLYEEYTHDINLIQNNQIKWIDEYKKIQSEFNFKIPDYIIDEIIENKNSQNNNKQNLICLINCAILNGTITRENGNKLKNVYA